MRPSDSHTFSPLFGEIAVELGLCTAAQVVEALCYQEELRERGLPADRIGETLQQLGILEAEDIRQVMRELESRTRTLRVPGFDALTLFSRGDATLTFRARSTEDHRRAQIVFLRFGLANNPEDLIRFLSDARGLSRLDHPNVVKVLDTGDLEGIPYLIMEDVPGPDLGGWIEENGPLPRNRALSVLCEIADGLFHAHSRRVLHGALKPAAIRLPRTGGAKLGDFAFSGWRAATGPATRVRMPQYISPEEARGEEPSIESDVYSLGVTFFHSLTGRPPFKGGFQEIVRQHRRRPAPDVRVLTPGLDEGLAHLVARMLEKDRSNRPGDLREVRLAAEALLGKGGAKTKPPAREGAPPAPGRLKTRRRRLFEDD